MSRKTEIVKSIIRRQFCEGDTTIIHEMFRNIPIDNIESKLIYGRDIIIMIIVKFNNGLKAIVEYRTPVDNQYRGWEILDHIISSNRVKEMHAKLEQIKLVVPKDKFSSTDEMYDKILIRALYDDGSLRPTTISSDTDNIIFTTYSISDFTLTYNSVTETYSDITSFAFIKPTIHALPKCTQAKSETVPKMDTFRNRQELMKKTILEFMKECEYWSAKKIHSTLRERIYVYEKDDFEIDHAISELHEADLIRSCFVKDKLRFTLVQK